MSKGSDYRQICDHLLPELSNRTNIKEVLLEKIQSMRNSYYKSRALSQLAQFYDEKSDELLNESFKVTKTIQKPILKFQVLENIFSIAHYKEVKHKLFIKEILNELVLSCDSIDGHYDRVIASIRLSFYGSRDFRKIYLTNAIETLVKMDEDDEKIKLIIKLKSLITIYDDLQISLNGIIENLKNKTHNYFINSYYGRILFAEKLNVDTLHSSLLVSEKLGNDNDNEQNEDVSNSTEIQALFMLFAQLNDIKLTLGKTDSLNQLWINLFKDSDNQSNTEKILKIALDTELFFTPQVAIIIDELVRNGKEDRISILFPYIMKPSNEVLPIVHRWFTDYNNNQIKKLAALLLTEAKHVFEAAIDTITDLLKSDNDQMRYRAQRIFQHPERDVEKPSKRISVIGEKTLMKILQKRSTKEHLPRIQTYLKSFFYDLLWDDPKVFQNLYENVTKLRERNSACGRRMGFFNNINFINNDTWNSIMQTLQSPSHPSYVEELFHSTMYLMSLGQIPRENWNEFAKVLSVTDTSQFKEKLYFVRKDVRIMEFILNEVCGSTNMSDETYFEILELKLITQTAVKIEDLLQSDYAVINNIGSCNFYTSTENLNQAVLDMLNDFSINIDIMGNLIKWLIQKMKSFKGFDDTLFSMLLCGDLLSLVSACAQKEDYLYRKITNSQDFDKGQMIKLLEKILNNHPYYPARGSSFILLSAMDNSDHKVIINAMNALFDENVVKEYSAIGIPLIHLSPNEFIDDLLKSLKNESAIKAYEILKILTQYALNEKIDANTKSKIINYLAKEIGELKSKKPISYYYTDIKIPFTTTLENELYKTWIKIQGLSGKTQYYTNVEASKE
ncbi:unnamed protein product [Didymodactylos carnosus]|uniref:Uncharacterized protein n=1 Tax=Didymodactylos carnosus TaxID=1234261 RepID=A0A8S2IV51_9BILA|nr:unnamed protein product [Didymodactylos carnosus]CAF3763147.1 unnamed protein product [Didymodactylos carnosus]